MTAHRNPKQLQAKSRAHDVHPLGGDRYRVTSGASGQRYSVNLCENACECEWGKHNPGRACSHILAARQWVAQFDGQTSVSAWGTASEAQKQHRRVECLGDVFITVRA